MTWNINASGNKRAVVDSVQAEKRNPETFDTPHWQSAKDHILNALSRVPDDHVVDVEAHGHTDAGQGYESVIIKHAPQPA